MQHAVFVYDQDGQYLDSLIHPDMPLSEYVAQHLGGTLGNTQFTYNAFQENVFYRPFVDEEKLTLPAPNLSNVWSPLGVHIDSQNNLWLTDVADDAHAVYKFAIPSGNTLIDWHELNETTLSVGSYGQGNGELLFPNKASTDSQGRIYVSDGNNGRIAVWDSTGNFLFNFAGSTGDGSLSLPRGLFVDAKDRLYVVDAVGQDVKVYDVSGNEPQFLHKFGDFGMDDGLFNYPNDIVIDRSGRLYIADRENNRVQVWSY